jgi:uncharacterized SAM-binding protein YcdF (DUF218 family)
MRPDEAKSGSGRGKTPFYGRARVWLALALCLGVALAVLRPGPLLSRLGWLLMEDSVPVKAGALVVLRGDADYSRAVGAARLFKAGYAPRIFVSTAVRDRAATSMASLGVGIPKEQDLISSILVQLGVPAEAIVLDVQEPGGGTLGEAKRLRAMAKKENCRGLLVVTSWFHTRRTAAIMRSVLAGSGLEAQVVRTPDDPIGPQDWWHYRYEAVNVLLEYAKWAIWLVTPNGDIGFGDNPGSPPPGTSAPTPARGGGE